MKSSRWQNVLNHFSGLLLFVFIFLNALSAFAVPGKTTYQAKIVKPDGYPLEASSVNFKFTILDPVGSCVLYSETYSSVNMSSTGGLISFTLGSGVKTYPTSSTTFEQVFSNITPSLSCDTGGPASYSPTGTDIRKIVMQFHDGTGWQTLPAMSINAVPYAMYANEATKLNGLQASDFVQLSTVPTCTASEALRYTGTSFSCVAVGNSVTSSTVVTALGYTPADGVSVTALTSNVSSVSSTVFSVSSTVTSLQNSVAASFAAITSSQWTTSGTNIFYNTGNVGIGTTTPVTKLDVSGGVRIGAESTTCAPALAGTLRYNGSNVEYCNGTSWQAFGVSGAGLQSLNGSTSGTQSFATGSGGTAPNIATANGVHTLNIPNASTGSVTAGLISNADYTTFTNKITSSAASIAQVLGYVPADNAASGTYAQKANNLSDLTNVATARTNLGLGTFATANSIDLGSASATGTLAIARLPSFTGDATIAAASNTIILSNSGVTAGAYTKVTVDSKGRVTSGSQIISSDVTTALGYTPANSATVVSSQWSTSGTNIFYNTGNIGIGTTSPSYPLDVLGSGVRIKSPASTNNALYLDSTTATGPGAISTIYLQTGGVTQSYIQSQQNNKLLEFGTSNTTRMVVDGSGNIGVGTTTPVTKLDVSGGVRIGSESTTCAPALAGTLRYNSGNVEYCNGTTWSAFGVATSGLTSLNGATSQTQSFANGTGGTAPAFNTSNGVHTLNIPLASTGSVTAGLISNTDYTTFTNKITSSAASIAQVLGYVPADNAASGTYAQKANNLSDLTNIATARTNLGLGTFATASSIDLGSASATGTLAIARLPSFIGDATIAAASNTIILSNSGVTAGTYTKVTVDAKGRVTSGSQIISSDITTALGYTPANSATTVSSQWSTSGTTINYMTGNVGIGTSAPNSKLDVAGQAWFGLTNKLKLQESGDALSLQGTLATDDNQKKSLLLNAWGGNVGVGTLTPEDTTGMASQVPKFAVSGGYANLNLLRISGTDTGNTIYSAQSALTISTGGGTNQHIILNPNGNVGIGTSSPGAKLDINAGSATGLNISQTGGGLYTSTAGGIPRLNLGGGSGFGINRQISSEDIFIGEPGDTGTFRVRGSGAIVLGVGAASTTMTIQGNGGNVGIGTTAPTAKLHLSAGTSSTAALKFTSGTLLTSPQSGTMEYDGTNFYLTDSANTRRAIAANTNPGTYDNVSNINSSSNITMTPTGSVVVSATTASTNSSTGALVVKGGLGVAGDIYASGTIVTSSNIQGVSVTATSGMISPYIAGSVASGGSLTLDSTTHSTKGNILLAPNGGNVGIGTTAPTELLHVSGSAIVGDMKFWKNLTGGEFQAVTGIGDLRPHMGTSGSFRLYSGNVGSGSEKFTVLNSGNVGVGTSTPANKLDVVGANNSGFRIKQGNQMSIAPASSTSFYNGVVLENGGSSHAFALGYTIGGHFGLNYFDGTSAYSNLWTITNSGNMGIGTTTPGYALSIYRSATGVTANIESGSNGSVVQNRYAGLNSVGSSRVWGSGLNITDGNGGYEIYDYTAGASRFLINSSGNVGIGTTTPGSALSIKSSTANNTTGDGFTNLRLEYAGGYNAGDIGAGVTFAQQYVAPGTDAAAIRVGGIFGVKTQATGNFGGGLAFFRQPAGAANMSEAMRIDQNGNVGIGVTSPAARLDVSGGAIRTFGGIEMPDGNSSDGSKIYSVDPYAYGGKFWIGYSAKGGHAFFIDSDNSGTLSVDNFEIFKTTSATSLFRVQANGNVGIGTTAPTQALEVNGRVQSFNDYYDVKTFTDGWAIGDYAEVVRASPGGAAGNSNLIEVTIAATRGNWVESATYQLVSAHSESDVWREVPASSVNYYTTFAYRCFTVDANGVGDNVKFRIRAIRASADCSASSTGSLPIYFSAKINGYNNGWTKLTATGAGATVTGFRSGVGSEWNLYTGASRNAGLPTITAKEGNVGIGTNNPGVRLEVSGGISTKGGEIIMQRPVTAGGWARGLHYTPDGNYNVTASGLAGIGLLGTDTTQNSIYLAFGSSPWASTTGIQILSSGNVGIGTTAPSERLHVVGNLRVQGLTDCTLGNGAGGTNCSSDARLKENIKPIPYALEKIVSLKGVEFDWNAKSTSHGRHDIGVIAQDVEKVFPSAVIDDKNTGYKKVDYAVLVAPLIQAVKELYNMIMGEKDRNTQQARQIAQTEDAVRKLAHENQELKTENAELKAKDELKTKQLNDIRGYLCSKDPNARICK